jgi:hypothetical protein
MRYRREAENTLLTYLVAPDDAALDTIPNPGAARSWLNNLPTRIRSCIICSN